MYSLGLLLGRVGLSCQLFAINSNLMYKPVYKKNLDNAAALLRIEKVRFRLCQ